MSWQTVGQGDGGRCWGGVDNVVVIVGLGVHKREPGRGMGPKNPKPERGGSVSGVSWQTA